MHETGCASWPLGQGTFLDGLSNRDLRLLRDVLDPQLDPEPGELIAQPVLDELARLNPSENVTLQVMTMANIGSESNAPLPLATIPSPNSGRPFGRDSGIRDAAIHNGPGIPASFEVNTSRHSAW